MVLATAASAVGKQVVTHAVRTWLGARRERGQRGAELIELVRIGVADHLQRRKLVRQLEGLADEIAERLRPVYEHDFRDLPEGERAAAPRAVVDALAGADLIDATSFAVDGTPAGWRGWCAGVSPGATRGVGRAARPVLPRGRGHRRGAASAAADHAGRAAGQ